MNFYSAVVEFFSAIWNFLCSSCSALWRWFGDFFDGLWDLIVEVWEFIVNEIPTLFASALEGVCNGLVTAFPSLESYLPDLSVLSDWFAVAELFIPLRLSWSMFLLIGTFYVSFLTGKFVYRCILAII